MPQPLPENTRTVRDLILDQHAFLDEIADRLRGVELDKLPEDDQQFFQRVLQIMLDGNVNYLMALANYLDHLSERIEGELSEGGDEWKR